MTVPDWWEFLLLALAVFRVYRLIAEDTILNRPRRYILRLDKKWKKEGDPTGDRYRTEWALFITCPWCLGFWLSIAWWVAFQITEKWTLVAATPWAISALVALTAKNLDKEEE